jgi:hypothetical protein
MISPLITGLEPDLTPVAQAIKADAAGAPNGNRSLCVTGFVSFFRQRPEMILSTPTQVFYIAPPSVAALQ